MALVVPGKWLWDFWLAQDGIDYHIFYLQADRSLGDQMLRHWNVSIGHAVSQDLRNWEILPDALKPGPGPRWDDKTTWTGSIIQHAGTWYMFYTGSSEADEGLVQRIGMATSPDLLTWTRYGAAPLIEADPQWYELLDRDLWHDQAWRDPFIYHDEESDLFHAFITARANHGPADARGVIGHATSPDLLAWTVQEPVSPVGEFGHLEVPQIVPINGRYYLVFCCPISEYAHARRDRFADDLTTGTFYLTADSLTGPYTFDTEQILFADKTGSLYSGKLVQAPGGEWVFMAFRNLDSSGNFIGDIIDPLPVSIDSNGVLRVGFP